MPTSVPPALCLTLFTSCSSRQAVDRVEQWCVLALGNMSQLGNGQQLMLAYKCAPAHCCRPPLMDAACTL